MVTMTVANEVAEVKVAEVKVAEKQVVKGTRIIGLLTFVAAGLRLTFDFAEVEHRKVERLLRDLHAIFSDSENRLWFMGTENRLVVQLIARRPEIKDDGLPLGRVSTVLRQAMNNEQYN